MCKLGVYEDTTGAVTVDHAVSVSGWGVDMVEPKKSSISI